MNQLKAHFSQKRLLNAVWGFVFSAMLVSTGHAQVGLKPVITNQPSDTIVLDNASATFRVGASSATTLSYKWYHNSNLISGATANNYTRDPAQLNAGHAGFYHVEVINAAGSTLSRVARLTILVSNDIPVANNDNYTTDEDAPLTIPAAGIFANDVDVYPGTLTPVLVSGVSQGSLSLNTDGSFIYTPNADFSGSDSFTYRAMDGQTNIVEANTSGGTKQEIRNTTAGAQSFRHGTTGGSTYNVKKVVLRLSKREGETNDLNFSIGTGINSGPIAGSSYTITMASISDATAGASFENYEIVYSSPVGPLTEGTTYYLNFANGPNGKDVFVDYASSNAYPRGTYYRRGFDASKDMWFEIHELTASGIATVAINVTPISEPLRFVYQQLTTNGIKFELSGPSLSTYLIQISTNLADWTPIFTNYTAGGNMVFTDTNAANRASCFYRAMIAGATNLQQNVSGATKVKIAPGQPGAQSFRHGAAGGANYGISKIVFRISEDSVSPNGNLIFSIGTGKNSGAVAGSTFAITPASVTDHTGGTSFQSYEIVYPEPIGPFTAGTTYYLNFITQSTNGKEYWLARSSISTYSGGTFYRAGQNLGGDMRFEIWGQ